MFQVNFISESLVFSSFLINEFNLKIYLIKLN